MQRGAVGTDERAVRSQTARAGEEVRLHGDDRAGDGISDNRWPHRAHHVVGIVRDRVGVVEHVESIKTKF